MFLDHELGTYTHKVLSMTTAVQWCATFKDADGEPEVVIKPGVALDKEGRPNALCVYEVRRAAGSRARPLPASETSPAPACRSPSRRQTASPTCSSPLLPAPCSSRTPPFPRASSSSRRMPSWRRRRVRPRRGAPLAAAQLLVAVAPRHRRPTASRVATPAGLRTRAC